MGRLRLSQPYPLVLISILPLNTYSYFEIEFIVQQIKLMSRNILYILAQIWHP